MPEHLPTRIPSTGPDSAGEDYDSLRILSRSPHPYHRQSSELLEASDAITHHPRAVPAFAPDSPPASESGTEADDEHFLKGLPAPKARLHKGLRGKNEQLSGASTPLLSPAVLEEEGRRIPLSPGRHEDGRDKRGVAGRTRLRRELIRRATEMLLLVCQSGLVASNPEVQPLLEVHQRELLSMCGLFLFLSAAYPLRLVVWAYRQEKKPSKPVPIRVPPSFDPAPFLYPPLVPILVSLLVSQSVPGAVLPTLVLSICALPRALVPGARYWEDLSCAHWLISCIPFALDALTLETHTLGQDQVPGEILVLLYPLHQTLCLVLHHLTTTSLLVSELQLLSVSLISLFLLARSPQAVVLKAVLWGGGLGLLALCGQVIQWGISLARVPKWRFRRDTPSARRTPGLSLLRPFQPLSSLRAARDTYTCALSDSDHSADGSLFSPVSPLRTKAAETDSVSDAELVLLGRANSTTVQTGSLQHSLQHDTARRFTLPSTARAGTWPKAAAVKTATTTPSGRQKRATSSSVRAFFFLTEGQAAARKWLYAGYVYLCILVVIFGGIRAYVQRHALAGHEPIGWALAYLLGDLPKFRLQVVKAGLERWICLPPRTPLHEIAAPATCFSGWVQHVRLASLGASNTRLALSAYWAGIVAAGLAVVFRLSPVCEVDTRRKVFHFMMVAMFLPATYVDPCYAALALALVLAIFLALDLLRASQLPPLSRPLARFLTPYVDGRDLRGPVVVSHMFLLVGCAIPLWLSLASLPRVGGGRSGGAGGGDDDKNGHNPLTNGWEVPTREVGMVSGVVCVGLGDAAASLVGRRWGHRKWLWGGGKSIEGSLAFAAAVFGGLMAAAAWLRVGGWPMAAAAAAAAAMEEPGTPVPASGMDSLLSVLEPARLWPWLKVEVPKTAVCSSLASLTEAVLTGGNDNVVVPVVLWGCVKSLGV